MADLFDNTILCKNCNLKMRQANVEKNGFLLRAIVCEKCGNKIVHPSDIEEYNRFLEIKGKTFKVKMRLVGNSYAVSIPKEIVGFIKEQEKIMNDMVSMCFNEAKKISLLFGEEEQELEE
ncbi:MAG: hypothetical protein NT076_00135 [Candidatus Pacearchaeota archaeon]|nr:hypothetical protein [Candidatus Pacearchaeota archaeon]